MRKTSNRPFRSTTVSDYGARIAGWQDRFDDALAARLPDEAEKPATLHRAMTYSALSGGKRFRPVLAYATGQALDLEEVEVDPVAIAIELIHAYSLIHDDLPAMDDDDLRRGRPTCHKVFGEATAILAGDALQALAFDVLARELPADRGSSLHAIRSIARACGSTGMAGGQALDMQATGSDIDLAQLENLHIHKTGALILASVRLGALAAGGRDIDVEDLKTMHRLKTGALIRASVTAPCILADCAADDIAHLDAYADCIGLAFQVHDDILDVTGDSELIGKNTCADAALDKPTFPSMLGLDASRRYARELRDQAVTHLEQTRGDTSVLAWLASYVISRDR